MNSQRFDLKERSCDEDLESRSDWGSSDRVHFMGEVHVLAPLEQRGREVPITMVVSWTPCFAIIWWNMIGVHMAIAVRPSPPYRDWAQAYDPPYRGMPP